MTRIDFYSNAESRIPVACPLVAWGARELSLVVVYAPDQSAALATSWQATWTLDSALE